MSRPGLDMKTRQMCTVAMLAGWVADCAGAQGAYPRPLQVGWTKDEIAEVLIQTAVYAGFPAAIMPWRCPQGLRDWTKSTQSPTAGIKL